MRREKETAVGGRKLHILVFNEEEASEFEINVFVSDFLGKNDIKIKEKENVKGKVSGKHITVNISHTDVSIGKVKINCQERTEKFEINYCIINCEKRPANKSQGIKQ